MQHTLIAIVENKPGVLNRVASLFRRRNFNIHSLNVGKTQNPVLSRMTITIDSRDTDVKLVEANLYKLVNVVDVQDVTDQQAILRELVFIKVKSSAEKRAEIISLVTVFKAQVIDVSADSLIVQTTAKSSKIDGMIELLKPFGIIELVRTGHIAMMRGAQDGIRHTPGAGPNGRGNG